MFKYLMIFFAFCIFGEKGLTLMGSKPLASRELFLGTYKSKTLQGVSVLANNMRFKFSPEALFPIPLRMLDPKKMLLGTHPIYSLYGSGNSSSYPNIHNAGDVYQTDIYDSSDPIDGIVQDTTAPIEVSFDIVNFICG